MKIKTLFFMLLCLLARMALAEPITNPVAGQSYRIVHSSGLWMSSDDSDKNKLKIMDPGTAAGQAFEFVAVEGTLGAYNIKLVTNGQYLATDGNYTAAWSSDATDPKAQFELVISHDPKYVNLKNVATGKCLGSDANTAGSGVYTDKNGKDGKHCWSLSEASDGLVTTALENTITTAEAALSKAESGDKPGQYPQDVITALQQAVDTAKSALESAMTQEEVNAAVAVLREAIATFNGAVIPPSFIPVEGAAYRISVNKYEDKYVTNINGSASATAEYTAGNSGQYWTSVKVEGEQNTFFLKNGDSALNYDFTVTAFNAATSPKWIIVYATTKNGIDYFGITQFDDPTKCITFSKGTTGVVQIYSASNNAHQARFTRVNTPNDPSLIVLENAIGAARVTLSNAVVGTTVGLYLQEVCDEFKAYLADCETWMGESGKTEENVAAKVEEVKTKEQEFKENKIPAIDKSVLLALLEEAKGKLADAVVGIEKGQFLQTQLDAMEEAIPEYEEKAKKVTKDKEYNELLTAFRKVVATFVGHAEAKTVKEVLADAVKSAQTLLDTQKDNIGMDKGQYPQDVFNSFKAAIEVAVGRVNSSDLALKDLTNLQTARKIFIDGVISVDRKALKEAVEAADAAEFKDMQAGEFDGNFPQDKIEAFNTALAVAKAAIENLELTQEDVDNCTKALNDAMKTLRDSKVVIDFNALDASLALAEPLYASVIVVGDTEGQCPQAALDAFKAVIDEVKAIDRKAIKQVDVDAAAEKLEKATADFKTALVASTGIQSVIAEAQALLDGAVKGSKPGNYPSGAYMQFNNAIDAANSAIAAEDATQASLLAAAETLKAAIEKFKSAVIPSHDLTELNALIAEAETFLAEHGEEGLATLKLALDKAKAIVNDPNNYTKNEVTSVVDNLKKALEIASGINANLANALKIYAGNGLLNIKGIQGNTHIAVYTVNGKLVSLTETADTIYTETLASGSYVITVLGNGVKINRVIIIE